MLPLELYPMLGFCVSSLIPPVPVQAMPCWASSCFNWRFSSPRLSLSRVMLLKFSFNRKTSCSRALMYNSFRSRWVLKSRQLRPGSAAGHGLPLRLAIQLLPPGQGGLAIWLGTPPLGWLAVDFTRGQRTAAARSATNATHHGCSSSLSRS
jgi:hypothetical protein